MILDLPTDCPPRNTILILVLPVTVLLIEWFIIQIMIIVVISPEIDVETGSPDTR